MTPQEVITEVRRLTQDDVVPYRNSDTVLLGFVNLTIKRICILRPDLFTVIADITPTVNICEQSLPATVTRLVDIFRNKNGDSIEEVDRDMFDRTYPQWTTDAAAAPTKFMRHPRNPRAYFLYPRPIAGTILVGEYVVAPATYAIGANIAVLPDSYFSVVVDGTIFAVESVDNEYVNNNRAKMTYEMFTQALGVDLQSRNVTDREDGGTNVQTKQPSMEPRQ
jgi:hypothetical protein